MSAVGPRPPAAPDRVATPPVAPGTAPDATTPSARGVGGMGRMLGLLAVFLLAVAVVMMVGQVFQAREEPWHSAELTAARTKLLAEPKNEALKTVVRELDQTLRRQYFRNLERNRIGAWLLLGSGVVLVMVARIWAHSGGTVRPVNGGDSGAAAWMAPDRDLTLRRSGRTVLAVGLGGAAVMVVMGVALQVRLPERSDVVTAASGEAVEPAGVEVGSTGEPPRVGPTSEELARNWPRFRGHDGVGRVAEAAIPLKWDTKTGEGVVWKAGIAVKGYSSPIIWNDRVFVTGGNRDQRLVFAYDAATGAALWARPVTPINAAPAVIEPPDQSGQAASTPATDGERVFAIFATGELGALDNSGNLVWHQRLDFTDNGYGHAASLLVWNDRLLIQADQGAAEDGKSVLLALDTRTGKTLWTAKRPVGGSWTTPIVLESGGRTQVVTAGDPWLMSHDVRTGAELWRAGVLGGELAPSPVFGAGNVYAISPGHAFSAVSPDGTGDVTATHVTWRTTDDVPDVPTPTVVGDLVFTANTEGKVMCRDAGTGAMIWQHEFELEIQASPLVVGERMYLFAQPGNVMVVTVGKTFETLSTFEMGEDVYATPAIAGDRLYLRTDRQLYCIGATGAPAKGEHNDAR